jgi:hypothetical protein
VKATKTGVTRKVPIRPALLPLLKVMQGSGRVVQSANEKRGEAASQHGMPPLEDLATTLREHLWGAGARRADPH